MTTNTVAIAKASLIAPFVRPDPTTVSRDELNVFHEYLEAALRQCSPTNIQRCRGWLSSYATTVTRISAIGKYLSALNSSVTDDVDLQQPGTGSKTSVERKRLHILYLLNDWFHFATKHQEDAVSSDLLDVLQKFVSELCQLIGSRSKATHPKLHVRIEALLVLWREQRYFDAAFIEHLQEVVNQDGRIDQDNAAHQKPFMMGLDETAPFVMPSRHGDPETPWYDLPAANMIPHITPNSLRPVDSQSILPVHLPTGLADPLIVTAVQDFLLEMENLYRDREAHEKTGALNYDALGQKVCQNSEGDDISYGGTYYGWSRKFCERMKIRLNDRTADRSRSRGRPPTDVRRNSPPSGSRSLSHNRWRSSTRSRSRANHRNHHRFGRSRSPRRKLRWSVSPSRSRSRSVTSRGREQSQSPPGNVRERSYSPPAASASMFEAPMGASRILIPPPPIYQGPATSSPDFSNVAPLGSFETNSFLQIPPRPHGWQGPWPPPPPPPPQQMHDHASIFTFLKNASQGQPQPPPPFRSENSEHTYQARYSEWRPPSASRH